MHIRGKKRYELGNCLTNGMGHRHVSGCVAVTPQ